MKATVRINGIIGLSLVTMMLMFFAENVNARKRPGSEIVAKTLNSKSKTAIQTVAVESEKNLEVDYIAPITMWTVVEAEEELFVKEYKPIVEAIPLWNRVDNEVELSAEDFKPADKLIPFWMIVEEESELEDNDL